MYKPQKWIFCQTRSTYQRWWVVYILQPTPIPNIYQKRGIQKAVSRLSTAESLTYGCGGFTLIFFVFYLCVNACQFLSIYMSLCMPVPPLSTYSNFVRWGFLEDRVQKSSVPTWCQGASRNRSIVPVQRFFTAQMPKTSVDTVVCPPSPYRLFRHGRGFQTAAQRFTKGLHDRLGLVASSWTKSVGQRNGKKPPYKWSVSKPWSWFASWWVGLPVGGYQLMIYKPKLMRTCKQLCPKMACPTQVVSSHLDQLRTLQVFLRAQC